MRRPGGYSIYTDPDGPTLEWDTVTCTHCQGVVFVKPGTASTVYLLQDATGQFTGESESGAFCRLCMAPICLPCHDRGGCTPWERQLEVAESRERLRKAVLGM